MKRYWWWLLLLVPVTLGLARMRFDVEVLNLLPADFPVVHGLKLYQQNFANASELIVTIEGPDAEITEATAQRITEVLRARPDLVANVTWQSPFNEHPEQAAEMVAFLWLNQRPETFGRLTNRLTGVGLTNTLLEAKQQLATSLSPGQIAFRGYDPYNLMQLPDEAMDSAPSVGTGDEFFASADGTFRVVFVEPEPDLSNYRECLRWLDQIKEILNEGGGEGQIPQAVQIDLTGRPAFVAEIAGGMERDMFYSVGGTMVIIAGLFYWAHRRWRPLLWLLVLLSVILGGTMGLGGLVFGTLSVVSMGFAAILLGLAVDYGMVLYQESQANRQATVSELRRVVGPSIVWSAVTTASAFAMLNLSGLPGLAQLGSLVSIGVVLAAALMLSAFLPPLLRRNRPGGSGRPGSEPVSPYLSAHRSLHVSTRTGWICTAIIFAAAFTILAIKRPGFDPTSDALKPSGSEAYATVERIKQRLDRLHEPLWVLIPGKAEGVVTERLAAAKAILEDAQRDGLVEGYTLPTTIWPQAINQEANRPLMRFLASQRDRLREALFAQGFTADAFNLTAAILDTWDRAASSEETLWPTNRASRSILGQLIARTPGDFLALGLVHPAEQARNDSESFSILSHRLMDAGMILSGWELLGSAIFDLVKKEMVIVLIPMFVLLLFSLSLAFRKPAEVLLSLGALFFAAFLLLSVMAIAGWSWNLLNMMALPLLLGAGVDYSIHMQHSLRRHHGDVRSVRRTVGRALFLCAATTFTAFGSLSFSSNAGMASLGRVCAAGIACAFVTAVFLLPCWWQGATAARPGRIPAA